CAARYESLEKEIGTLAATCRWDIARFCSDVTPGRGEVARCLERQGSDLSPECKDRLQKARQPAAQ
ncbi:cysteine rich repeat-containing protein, partial [Salmonella sp. SAL4436]|uniref:cysteine rich repeat-containing protein n=1 Tax=Salmonella sp. SAL4436 TaxID=3159891 RepID=UPI00397C372E